MAADLAYVVIWFRLIERGFLTVFVVLTCIWLSRKYVDRVTKIQVSAEKLPISTISATIGTPILIALLFVGYAYIDLSNRIALGPLDANMPAETSRVAPQGQPSAETPKPAAGLVFQGLNGTSEKQASVDGPRLAFALWSEQSLQRVFVSLVNLEKAPLTPQATARAMNLALAVGCLNSEATHPSRNFDSFVANRDFEQVDTDIANALKSHAFVNPFCQAIQQEL